VSIDDDGKPQGMAKLPKRLEKTVLWLMI